METKETTPQELSTLKQAFLKLEEMEARLRAAEKARREPVAVIGVGCRLPGGADTPEAFWKLLHDGVDAVAEVPADRWSIDDYFDPDPEAPDKMTTRFGAFLDSVDGFDPRFFGISPREAVSMDPQQRLLLEVSWQALEHAAQAPDRLEGSRLGVYVGLCTNDYEILRLRSSGGGGIDNHYASGIAHSIVAGRLSYFLGTTGPSMVIDTACSSSLVAVHLACQSLRLGESDMALAGGVNVILAPENTIALSKAGMMAKDGRCKAFDNGADGFVRGEGGAVIVLKRLSDALKNGDSILALIRGSAVNHDGASSGLTVPSGPAQEAVIRKALRDSAVTPLDVQYVECHGTGTSLGDPIEVQALMKVYGKDRPADAPLLIGSVKTNLGHLEAAAGIAGLIKVVLALRHGQIPAHLHLSQPNAHIAWEQMPVQIASERSIWPVRGGLRMAAVSAFGFSGTNAHVVLQDSPAIQTRKAEAERPLHILGLSAKSKTALKGIAALYERHLKEQPSIILPDVCFTANAGRAHFEYRFAATAPTLEMVHKQLKAFEFGKELAGVVSAHFESTERPKPVFLFTGQGSQYVGMGRELFDTQPSFRRVLERCDELLRPHLERPLLSVLYPEGGKSAPLDQTAYTQPVLFALEYALAELWRFWGIEPSVVMGHSVGEVVAACVAGLFSLENGLKLIAARARLMQALPAGGRMAAVFADEDRVVRTIAPYRDTISLAAVNGPESMVISGAGPEMETVLKQFEAEGIGYTPLNVSHAFHSPLMEPILEEFEGVASGVNYGAPSMGLVSNVSGTMVRGKEMAQGGYWRRHVRQPVRFCDSMKWLYAQGYRVFVEIGPHPVLLGMGARFLPEGECVWLASLRRGQEDWQQMLASLAELYVRGIEVNWNGFDRDYPRRKVALPTYPFQRQRYWIERKAPCPVQADKSAQERNHLGDWLYELKWQPRPLSGNGEKPPRLQKDRPGAWLIFADRTGVARALSVLLEDRGEKCVLVYAGEIYDITQYGQWQIDCAAPEQYPKLMHDAGVNAEQPFRGVIHLWSLDAETPEQTTLSMLESNLTLSCGSVLHITQALARLENPPSAGLWLVTRGAQKVSDKADTVAIAQAPLWGFGRTIAAEQPDLWGGLIDLDPSSPPELSAKSLVQALFESQREDQIAFRDGRCLVARLDHSRQPLSKTGSLKCHSGGSYIITGGLGGIGSAVARLLISRGARWLLILERTPIPPRSEWRNIASGTRIARKIAVIQELEALGAKVLTASVDVGDETQLRSIFAKFEAEHWPPIRGVMHAAGVTQYQPIAEYDFSMMKTVMQPKIMGGWLLHGLLKQSSLDFFVLFSSSAVLLNSPLVGSYAAANAFLDALAHYRKTMGLPALSVNWGAWVNVGMGAEFENDLGHPKLRGVEHLSPELGLVALEELLLRDSAQTAVMSINWHEWSTSYPAYSKRPIFENLVQGVEIGCLAAKQEFTEDDERRDNFFEQLRGALPSRRKKVLLDHVGRQAAQVLGLTAWQAEDYRKPLRDLGLDSLLAVELRDKLSFNFSRKLPATLLFDYPTIEEVTDYLVVEMPSLFLATDRPQASSMESAGNRTLVEDIERLSEDDVNRLFEERLEGSLRDE